MLCLDLIDYGVLGRFESFESDFATILRSLGAPAALLDELAVVVGASARSPAHAAYSPALAQHVYETYRADFETFGYAQGSWRDDA